MPVFDSSGSAAQSAGSPTLTMAGDEAGAAGTGTAGMGADGAETVDAIEDAEGEGRSFVLGAGLDALRQETTSRARKQMDRVDGTARVYPPLMQIDPEELGTPNAETLRAVSAHMKKYGFEATGAVQQPAHEQRFVYTTVHVCPPTADRAMVTMYTTGMSDRRMVGIDDKGLAYAELVLFLPADWPIATGVSDDPRLAWSVQWLEGLTRYPHLSKRGLGSGHLIPTGDTPLAGTGFTAFMLVEPKALPSIITTRDMREIQLLALIPLYPEEVVTKRKHGTNALLSRFEAAGITEVVDPQRANVGDQPKKPFWKLW